MINVDEARKLTKEGEVKLNIFNKLQLAYVNLKIKRYAKLTLEEVSVKFLSWKVADVLAEKGYKIYDPLPGFLNPNILPDVTTIISWEKEKWKEGFDILKKYQTSVWLFKQNYICYFIIGK